METLRHPCCIRLFIMGVALVIRRITVVTGAQGLCPTRQCSSTWPRMMYQDINWLLQPAFFEKKEQEYHGASVTERVSFVQWNVYSWNEQMCSCCVIKYTWGQLWGNFEHPCKRWPLSTIYRRQDFLFYKCICFWYET